MPPLLYLLALGNLVIGSSAFVLTGIVGLVAHDLGVGVPAAGQSMTVYALATAFGAPLLVVATARWPRKRVLVSALALFTLGNAVCAVATSLPALYGGRVLMGLGSMFTPVAASVALGMVEPARRGKALSTVFLGMSLSYVIGVPLGTWIGAAHGWHAALWAMTAASGAMVLATALGLPKALRAPAGGFAGLGAALRLRPVLALLGTTMLYFSAIFTVFSYIAPVLGALVPGVGPGLVWTLMLFGLAGVAGTLLGGAAADRFGAQRTQLSLLFALAAAMALLPLTRGHYAALLAVMLAWGGAGFGLMAPQQARLAQLAPAQTPLLLSLNASMLYVGTALGAAIGGVAVAAIGFDRLPWAGAPLALAGALLSWIGGRARPTPLAIRADALS
ncbi:MAG: MFS transporter [Rubrivivax sp.]